MEMARVVLGVEEHEVAEEVMHFLDRSGRARVVATASDDRQLAEAVRQLDPDAVIASTALVGDRAPGRTLLALETAESVRSLRTAIRAGASGYFVWPREREALAAAVRPPRPAEVGSSAVVAAVVGASGGVGATFVATHLAAALARRSAETAFVDLDVAFAGASAPLGAPGDGVLTAADAAAFGPELGPEQVRELLWRHPEGFGVLVSPGRPDPELGAVVFGRTIAALSRGVSALVLHLPREVGPLARVALAAAQHVLVVVRLDVASFRDARRYLDATETAQRARIVVNRASRADVTPADVERVFGRPAAAVIGADRRVPRAQAEGRILPARGRTGRAFDRLARLVLEGSA